MTTLGWVFLLSSTLFVWGLTGWCYYKVMTVKETIEIPPAALGG